MNKYLSIEQVAELLSVKVKTIYGWVHCDSIPYYKFGRLVRFKESEVEEWAEKKRQGLLVRNERKRSSVWP